MTDIERMRMAVQKMYPGKSWKNRVRRMSDSQVTSIYMERKLAAKAQEAKKKLEEKS